MKLQISLAAAVLLLFAVAAAQTPDPVVGAEKEPLVGPVADVSLPPVTFLDYIGQPEQIGTTWYDYQHNSSMSRMIAYGDDGSIHCAWMNGLDAGATQRVIYYNKKDPLSATWVYGTTGMQVNQDSYAGYCTLDLDMSGNPVIAYHARPLTGLNYTPVVWNSTGEHYISTMPPGVTELTWPHVAVDTRDYIHVVAATNPTGQIYYTRSEDGGLTWIPWELVVDWGTGGAVSQTICSDLATGKVAIGYCRPITTSTFAEDVYYVESTDGVTWDFANPVNITDFEGGGHPMSESTRAYADLNMLYDSMGNLHIVYTSIPYPYQADTGGMIWHWSEATGHCKVTGTFEENAWTAFNDPGAWRYPIDRPHIAESNVPAVIPTLYVQWGQCTTPGDVSAGGYGNWDVYVTYSTDGGMNWMAPVNVTDTQSPGAPAGQCMSENWANLAKVASDKMHIQYIFDLDAGGIPQNEGTWTENPVFYQGVPVDSILTNMLVDIEPDTVPFVIPPSGGSFDYTVSITNMSAFTIHFDGWLVVELPTGGIVELISRTGLMLPPGGAITRTLTMFIPGAAPAGDYTATLSVGDYGWNIWGEDSIFFTKGGVDAAAGGSWACTGWEETANITASPADPGTRLQAKVSPNPFNPATTIRFELDRAARTDLSVFDLTGRKVATLVEGWLNTGTHEVTFDASGLPSGVYLYRITSGSAVSTGKLVLMK